MPQSTRSRPCPATSIAVLALALACGSGGERTPVAEPPSPAAPPPAGVRLVAWTDGFYGPESVRFDPDQDVFFVSSMLGPGSERDGAGYIVRVSAADPNDKTIFVQGGRGGVTLNAPKGMALQGDTLWVADIDVVRGFDRRTGAPVGAIDLAPLHAQLLNDVAAGPDGTLWATDTGVEMSFVGVIYRGGDKVFEIGPDRSVRVVASGPALRRPDGVTWDPGRRAWVVTSFDPFVGEVYTLRAGSGARTVLARSPGKVDGVEALGDGRLYYTCWNDSSVHLLADGRDRRIIRGLAHPADLGVDTRRGRLAIPLTALGRVEYWQLPPEMARTARTARS